jgi:transposase
MDRTEGINNKLETMKRDARGFGSKAKFRIAALFHCGGLSLYPTPPAPA